MPKSEIKPCHKNITLKAKKVCAEWLIYCLKVGWPKKSLNTLESIWWKYHDRFGNLVDAKSMEHQSP